MALINQNELFDNLKHYIDTKIEALDGGIIDTLTEYKVKEVGTNINDVAAAGANIGSIISVLLNMPNININAAHINDINEVSKHIGQVTYHLGNIDITANNINPINVDAQNIEEIKTVANDILSIVNVSPHTNSIDVNALNIEYIKTLANILNATINNGDVVEGNGQYYGKGNIKPIGYLATSTVTDETITIISNTNGFAVDNLTIANGAELVIEDKAVFKIL